MRHGKGVLYLVIEESHEIAMKEQSGIGNENMSIHWAKKLATAGRSKGIRLIVATQCIQKRLPASASRQRACRSSWTP